MTGRPAVRPNEQTEQKAEVSARRFRRCAQRIQTMGINLHSLCCQ
jgi:hypothetical protein